VQHLIVLPGPCAVLWSRNRLWLLIICLTGHMSQLDDYVLTLGWVHAGWDGPCAAEVAGVGLCISREQSEASRHYTGALLGRCNRLPSGHSCVAVFHVLTQHRVASSFCCCCYNVRCCAACVVDN